MKKSILSAVCALALCSTGYSQTLITGNHVAVQAAIATGGSLGIGLTHYSDYSEFGFTLSGKYNNASNQTKTITPVFFAGLRKLLGENTYFAYGLDFLTQFGKDNGQTINSDYAIGPYISLEQALTTHLLLVGWIDPYVYEYEKKGGVSTSTNRFFSSGGIGLSYLF